MKKFLVFFLGLSFILGYMSSVQAEEVSAPIENQEELATENDVNLPENAELTTEKKPEFEVVHKVEIAQAVLPTCDDKTLMDKTSEYISAYFDKTKNESTLYRRHRYFTLHNLNNFTKENIANYKTSATRPVSDVIADVRTNGGIAEENMLLCKNQSKNSFANKLYILVYPFDDGYKVNVINLGYNRRVKDKTEFTYKN